MPLKRPLVRAMSLLISGLCCVAMFAIVSTAHAQSVGDQAEARASEIEAVLFVQSLPMKDGREGIHLVWVPRPLQRLCLGKTAQQCADIDYCVRTTNRDVSTCRKLGIPLSRLPSYPPGMIPRRQLSEVFFALTPDHFTNLQEFFHRAPRASFEHLSMGSRVKARVRFTRNPDDDDFDVLDILAVAPF
jgi:hypothetical protein